MLSLSNRHNVWRECMYIDGVIFFSLVVVALMLYMMVYIGQYAKKHIDMDEKNAQKMKDDASEFPKQSH